MRARHENRSLALITVLAALLGLVALLVSLAPALSAKADENRADPGVVYERQLQRNAENYFGFGRPVAASSTAPSSTAPGDQAVELAKSLKIRVVSDKVGANGDQIALWPNDARPTHAIICNEIDGTAANAQATVQLVKLSDGSVTDMVRGLVSCDPAQRTPWGTIIVGEEAGAAGKVYEIINPLSFDGSKVANVVRATGASDDARVIYRSALGTVSYEGLSLLPNGTVYYLDELRPSSRIGGGVYKFVPTTPFAGGSITDLSQSPLVSGSVYALRLGDRPVGAGTDIAQGSQSGAGRWIALPNATGASLATIALAQGGYTGFYRPEDMSIDPIAAAEGRFRTCWTNTGNDVAGNWGEVVCLTDAPDAARPTGTKPVVEPFVLGNASLRMPDNLAFQPKTGILYIEMDATTSAEDPNFSNDDIWACLPDGADTDALSDGCVRVATLLDGAAEFTGIQFLADGKSFLTHLQHRFNRSNADLVQISGIKVEGKDN